MGGLSLLIVSSAKEASREMIGAAVGGRRLRALFGSV